MEIRIVRYSKELIPDVIAFERELRVQEPETYFWDIDDEYVENIRKSFDDRRFVDSAVSMIAYCDDKVVGRIDASLIFSHFDGTVSGAYLDWICVLKSERHKGIGQALLDALKDEMKVMGINSLNVLTAGNDAASGFYDNCDGIRFMRGAVIDF